jgi:hypothetical protein
MLQRLVNNKMGRDGAGIVEGVSLSVIWGIARAFAWMNCGKPRKLRLFDFLAHIWTLDLPNTKQGRDVQWVVPFELDITV